MENYQQAKQWQWCPACNGMIQGEAQWCRFCKKSISKSRRDINSYISNPGITIKELRAWLVDLDHIIEELPDSSFKSLIEEAIDLELEELVHQKICEWEIYRHIHFQKFAEPLIEGGKLQQAETILHKGLSLLDEEHDNEDHRRMLIEQLTAALHKQWK